MRTLSQKFQQILMFFLCLTLLAGFNAAIAETQQKAATHAHETIDWPGVYNGFLPCADCNGVKTSLALNANGTYLLMTQNIGKSLREFTEKGKFVWNDDTNTIVLTPRSSTITRQYLVGDNNLTELDSKGNRITGRNADSYVLRRNDVTAKAPKHLH